MSDGENNYEIRPIPGYPGYMADTNGEIWSERQGKRRKLKPCRSLRSAPYVILSCDGTKKLKSVPGLVLETFGGPRPEGMVASHRDENSLNTCPENLYWGTRSGAAEQAARVRHKRGTSKKRVPPEIIEQILALYPAKNKSEIGRQFGRTATCIARIIKRHMTSIPQATAAEEVTNGG